jgi:hypothetical protein
MAPMAQTEVGPAENQLAEVYESAMAIDFFVDVYATYAALPYLLKKGAAWWSRSPPLAER